MILHPGQSKKVGAVTVVCTTKAITRTKSRVVLRPGYQVTVRGVLIRCVRVVTPTPVPTPTPTPTPTPPPTPVLGTRGNPYPLGSAVPVKDWTVRINWVKFNAWPDVLAANKFNDAPASGWEDVVTNLTLTYTGSGVGHAIDRLNYVGASSVAYPLSGFAHFCGVPPAPKFSDFNEVFSGGTVTGNDCFQVQVADEASLVGYWNGFLQPAGPFFALR